MKQIEGVFSGARLRLAREFHGLTGAQLAAQVAVSQPFLSKLEGGEKEPSDLLLAALSETLGFDPPFFFAPPFEVGECHFRSRKTTPLKVKRRALAHGTLFGILISYLETRVSLPRRDIPRLTTKETGSPAAVAERCRAHWGLGVDVPINNVTRVLENAGAVVTTFAFPSPKVDAFTRPGTRDIVVLNTLKGYSHNRWDKAHELGHLVMHRDLACDQEDDFEGEADLFARELLLPRRAIEREFRPRKLDWGMLFDLKRRWKTSVSALVRRGHELGLLTSAEYMRAYKYYRAKRWHKGEPYEPGAENPEVVPAAMSILERKKGEPPLEVARQLHWLPHIFEEVLGYEVPRPIGPLAEIKSLDQFRQARQVTESHTTKKG